MPLMNSEVKYVILSISSHDLCLVILITEGVSVFVRGFFFFSLFS